MTGLIRGEQAAVMLDHASTCDQCAELLYASIDVFQNGDTPIEQAERPLVATPMPQKRSASRWIPLSIAAAIVATIGAALFLYSILRTDPLDALGRIYSQNRSIEMRFDGAPFGQLRVERASGRTVTEQPPQLLKAAASIQDELSRNPRDPRLLQSLGRLALLQWQPATALKALEESRDAGPLSAALLIDLAIAYYETAEANSDPAALNQSLDLLGQALRLDPNNPAALFNRALVLEKLHQTRAAIEDLEKLLSVEPSGPWSEESRRVLARLRTMNQRFFERPPEEDLDRFDETRLDRLLVSTSPPDSLAERWREAHGDPWLQELKSAWVHDPGSAEILARMAAIRLSMERGRYKREQADFERVANRDLPAPLASWRDFEALYRATHARSDFPCPPDPNRFLTAMRNRGYTWLLTQALREQSYCSFQHGDLASAETYALQSVDLAREHSLPVAAIRTEAVFAHIAFRHGRYREAFRKAQDALATIERQRLPVARSQEFLNISMLFSQANQQWDSAFSYAKSMTEVARLSHFADLQFTNTVAWAQMALRCGDTADAKKLFENALNLYQSLAPNDDRIWAEIGLAEATGDESRLAALDADIQNSTDALLWIPYQRVRAKLAADHGRFAEAHNRLARLEQWMETASGEQTLRWQSELRAASEINLDLLAKEERIQDSFSYLQKWRRDETPSLHLSGVASRQLPSSLVVSFASVGSRIAVWKRDGLRVEFRWATLEKPEVERLARRFHRLLATRESDLSEILSTGREIESALFGGWLQGIREDQDLLLQTDGVLSNLAFSALPGARDPLGAEHAISLTQYSIPEDFRLSDPQGSSSRGGLLIVDASHARPSWAPDLPALPSAEREVAAIERLSQPPVEVIRGGGLTAAVFQKKLASASALHFAGHALLTGNGAALVLPNTVAAESFFELSGADTVMPPLVVLSACSTGVKAGHEVDTGDPESLAASFLQKGSREVIASLWNVDSESTSRLMTQFYSNLDHGLDTGHALSQAMRSLRGSSDFSHPYHWAAFTRFIRP